MNPYDTVVSVASWEDRFIESMRQDIKSGLARRLLILYYAEYASHTATNRILLEELCREYYVKFESHEVSFTKQRESWQQVKALCREWVSPKSRVLVEISTMPREMIWMLFSFIRSEGGVVSYSYRKPGGYTGGWLSRDPGLPRLVLKHSGITELGRQTALIVTTGFDTDRTKQLIRYYEPKEVALFMQPGPEFESTKRNMDAHRGALGARSATEIYALDAYSGDHGKAAVERVAKRYMESYNVIMASLGPKPSAVALYRVWLEYPEIALAYTPSNEYNRDYSQGTGDTIRGELI